MQDIKEFYILCQPIETRIGQIHFLKVKDYINISQYTKIIFLQKKDLLNSIDKHYIGDFDKVSFLDIITHFNNQVFNLYQLYKDLFILCYKEDVFDLIESDDELYYYLNLIKNMNYLQYEKPSSNCEIEKFNIFKRVFQKKNNDSIDFESIYTSVWLGTKQKPDDLYIYEMYALFYRLGQFKKNSMTTLFATVAKDVKIENWFKAINLFDLEEKKMSLNDFKDKSKKIFSK